MIVIENIVWHDLCKPHDFRLLRFNKTKKKHVRKSFQTT